MALRVGLPLNGNLNNQGLDNTGIETYGTISFIDNGKIGKAYASGEQGDFKVLGTYPQTNKLTLCFGVKPSSSAGSGTDIFSFGSGHHRLERSSSGTYQYYVDSGKTALMPNGTTIFESLPVDQGSHITMTVDENLVVFYINGAQRAGAVATSTLSNIFGENNKGFFYFGCRYEATGYYKGNFNDIRIYDECLSQKQIKEISKGLVAHYKLEGTGANLNLISSSFSSGWSSNGSSNTYTQLDDYSFSIQYTAETISGSAGRYKGINGYFTEGKTYTFSYEIKGDGAYQIKAGFEPSANIVTTTTDFKRYHCTYTATTTGGCAIVFYSNGTHNLTTGSTITVRNMKLEEGNIATTGVPNITDITYTALGYDNMIARDVSGNGYNGTVSGTLSYNIDSPRYSGSTKFDANTSYIKLPALTTGGFASSFTIIYGANIADMNGKMAGGFSDGNRLNIYPTGSVICCNTGDGSNNPYQNNGSSIAYSQGNNGWHQFAMVADGSTNKLYVDGQYQGTAKTYKGITGTQMYISGWDTGTSYRGVNGSISDFRIYATALTADDILTLYKTSGIIDNKGNVYAYEFKEE